MALFFEILLLITLSTPSSFAKEAPWPNCTDRYQTKGDPNSGAEDSKFRLADACKEWEKDPSLYFKKFENGTSIPNYSTTMFPAILSDEDSQKVEKAVTPGEHHKLRIQSLFRELKNLFADRIKGTTSKEHLNEHQQFLLKRLEGLELRFVDRLLNSGCESNLPKMFSDPARDMIEVCTRGANMPLESLIPLIAHEIGHFMDPCLAEILPFDEKGLADLKADSIKKLTSCGMPAAQARASTIAAELTAAQTAGFKGLPLNPQSRSTMEFLLKCGLVKMPTTVVNANLSQHPFGKFQKCAANIVQNNAGTTRQSQISGENHGALSRLFSAGSQCVLKATECYADHVGAEMTADYISKHAHSLHSEMKKELLTWYTINACREGERESGRYPNASLRLSAFLQYPEIQNLLGCKGITISPACPHEAPARAQSTDTSNTNRK